MTYNRGDNPTTPKLAAIKEIAEWVDAGVIAHSIAEALADAGMEPTPALMTLVWLSFLETELTQGLESLIENHVIGSWKVRGRK